MGEKVVADRFDLSDRRRYRQKLHQCLEGLRQLLEEKRFDRPRNLMGLEIELNLADAQGQPLMVNGEVLRRIASSDFQTELGQFNLEVNIVPHALSGRVLDQLAEELRTGLAYADRQARKADARIVMIGTLPTLTPHDLTSANLTEDDRYRLLNDQIMAARGEDVVLDIDGVEHLRTTSESIAPESACTSVQLHLQVTPGRFADVWNAAQAVSGAQIAMGANSPFLFGHELWRESRIPLFLQATDTRTPELCAQGVRPRTWFGERWISSAYDLFEENVRYFPALLPVSSEEDPAEVFAAGGTPSLSELRLHNGTIYRWNRPIYDVKDGRPHLRVENRVLPAGPTVLDMLANSAFYYGCLHMLSREDRPLWTRMSFGAAHHNFVEAARHGMHARLYWPGSGDVTPDELVLRELLPLAHEGLRQRGVAAAVRERYLGVIEGRAKTGRNGARWQVATVEALQRRGLSRPDALAEMLRRYCQEMHSNEPVHTWAVPA